MSYQKQNFANGEVLSASQLNHIEQGIVDVESAANATKTVVDKIIDPTLSLSGKAADAANVGEAVGQLKEDLRNENLFVKQSAVIGVRLAANGTTVVAEDYFTSDYIPIERALKYKKNSPLINVYHRMCVYDTAKIYIKNIYDTNELYNEDGAYVRFCGLLTEIDEAKFIQCNAYDSISRLEIEKIMSLIHLLRMKFLIMQVVIKNQMIIK